MLDFQHGLEILIGLGLTSRQSKIYLATLQLEKATAKEISDISGVRRENVYRIIPTLRKIGLIEEIITHPLHFKAVPIKDAVHILMNRRKEHTSELEQGAKRLIRTIEEKSEKNFVYEENGQFVLIPVKKYNERIRKEQCESLQSSLKVVTSWKRFCQAVFVTGKYMSKALGRGVKIRYIMNLPENNNVNSKSLRYIMGHPNFEARYVKSLPESLFAICDKKNIYVVTSPEKDLLNSSLLSSNNKSLVTLISDCFETMWITALEKPQYNIDQERE